jgi:preprotein translocase subunit SecA
VTSLSDTIEEVRRLEERYRPLDDEQLQRAARLASRLPEVVALAVAVASRVLGLDMFDVQIEGALGLARGRIVEMQTGEGKTLAAVPAVAWHARAGGGVHVLTANDYLAQRDAAWMGEIYRWLGLSVAAVHQGMDVEARRRAYRCDVTYASANELGFDHLRDGLALGVEEQVLRQPAVAVVDEADAILLDEARIPLVIAGGIAEPSAAARDADRVVRRLVRGAHYTVDEGARNIALTPAGVADVERLLACENIYDAEHLDVMTAVQDALHAHVLLQRDVDYLVQDSAVLSIDELRGRVVRDRRWPAGLQTAVELKEAVTVRRQGRVLGSITMENLVSLYPTVCGMTGTAAGHETEFEELYALDVDVIRTNRPVIRIDHPDRRFTTRADKELAVLDEIRQVHGTGRPVLVGTSSVEESERLSARLHDVPHQVLNARNEAAEAAIVALAGHAHAVTISTNMAGRGVDIQLGPGVAALGGLHVIGTNRHESRRIDNQLRGRAGRQGDPGSSQFFVSNEDPLVRKYAGERGADTSLCDHLQRVAEGQSLGCRLFLRKYERIVEGQRQEVARRRQDVLSGGGPPRSGLERQITLLAMDDSWSDYLASVSELKAATIWVSLGGGNPFQDYLFRVHGMFEELQRVIDEEVAARLARAIADGGEPPRRGATWTYLTTDQPFGTMTERFMRKLAMMIWTVKGL